VDGARQSVAPRHAGATVVEENRRQGPRQGMLPRGSGFDEFDTDTKKIEKASITVVTMGGVELISSYQADDDDAMDPRSHGHSWISVRITTVMATAVP
jgi:hypothetical protein